MKSFFANIGGKVARKASFGMLLDSSDLGGQDWVLLDERAWRTGSIGANPSEAAKRAMGTAAFTALRSFEQHGTSRWVWVQAIQYASETDAEMMVSEVLSNGMANRSAKVTLVEERRIEGQIVAGASDVFVLEQLTEGMTGGPSATAYVSASVGRVLSLIACSGYRGTWHWEEVMALATAQSTKIRGFLDGLA